MNQLIMIKNQIKNQMIMIKNQIKNQMIKIKNLMSKMNNCYKNTHKIL